MKFASLLKQHNNKIQPFKPITINCNQNNLVLNLRHQNNANSSSDYQNQYQQNQNAQYTQNNFKNWSNQKPFSQTRQSSKQNYLHQVFQKYQQDKNAQWVIQICEQGYISVINLNQKKSKLNFISTLQRKDNKFQQSNKKVSKQKIENLKHQKTEFRKETNRNNLSPMKIDRKNKVFSKNEYQKHPIFENIELMNQIENINKFSFGDESQKKSSQIQQQIQCKSSTVERQEQKVQNLIQKFKTCQVRLLDKLKNQQNLQQSIQFKLQKVPQVQFSFQENIIQSNPIKPVVLTQVKKTQIKQIDELALKTQEKYQIKVVQSQFHISSQSSSEIKQINAKQIKKPLDYYIREEEKFIIKNKAEVRVSNKVTVQNANDKPNLLFNRALPTSAKQINTLEKNQNQKEQRKTDQNVSNQQNGNKIYCRANIKTLTPEKLKYQKVGGQFKQKQQILFRNQTQKIISLDSNVINQEDNNLKKQKTCKKRQNQQQQSNLNLENSSVLNNVKTNQFLTPSKTNKEQVCNSDKSNNKFLQFLRNKKSGQVQNDRVMRIVLHSPIVQNELKTENNNTIKLKQNQKLNELNEEIKSQIKNNQIKIFDFDRPQTPTPTTKAQQYDGKVSPKSKPKIGKLISNFNFQQTKKNGQNTHILDINNQNQTNKQQNPLTLNQTNLEQTTLNQNNNFNQYVTNTQKVNYYGSTRDVSPNKIINSNNKMIDINSPNNILAPFKQDKSINVDNKTNNYQNSPTNIVRPSYVPYYHSHNRVLPVNYQKNNINQNQVNILNLKEQNTTLHQASTHSAKPYIPYYNLPNKNQNFINRVQTNDFNTINKPKAYNQLANLQKQNQTVKNQQLKANNQVNLNQQVSVNSHQHGNGLQSNLDEYKSSATYQYKSPFIPINAFSNVNNLPSNVSNFPLNTNNFNTHFNSNNFTNGNLNVISNPNSIYCNSSTNQNYLMTKKQEKIAVSPFGEYTKMNTRGCQQVKKQVMYQYKNKQQQNHINSNNNPQSSVFGINNVIFNPQTADTFKNDYLKPNYCYKTQTLSTGPNCNPVVQGHKPSSPNINYIPLSSPRNMVSDLRLIQGAKHAESKVYEIKQGSSNSDINFSVESYN